MNGLSVTHVMIHALLRGPLVAMILLATGCAMNHASATLPSDDVSRSVAVKPGGELILDLQSGGTVNVQGWDDNRVSVRAHRGGRDAGATDVRIQRVRSGVLVLSSQRRRGTSSTAHVFDIRVPRRYSIRLKSTGGGLAVRDVDGTFRGSTAGGAIAIDHVRGRAELSTGGGTVRIADAEIDGYVTTGGGRVTVVNTRGDLRTESGGGNVIGAAPQAEPRRANVRSNSTPALLQIHRAGGPIAVAEAPHGADIRTGGGAINIGRAEGPVRASTGAGNIDLGPVNGSVHVRTGKGDVRVSVDALADGSMSIDIESGYGGVTLELPANLSANLDLETAYTDTFGRRTQIVSAWALVLDETTDWDSSRGTPRRYVRSRLTIGTGGPVIHVRTVNGDIALRQTRQ